MKLELSATYGDWDTARGDRVMVYLAGEFVAELEPVRKPHAGPGDKEDVARETVAAALGAALRAGQRVMGGLEQFQTFIGRQVEREVYAGQDCTSCGTSFEQCGEDIAAHNNSGCCDVCRDFMLDPHTVTLKGAAE